MKPTRIDLVDAVVVVTGAGRGIGRATADLFARHGAHVAVADLDADAAHEAAQAIGARAQPFQVDVSSRDSFAALIEAVEDTLGPVDILVNNAGVMPLGRFLDEDDALSAVTLDVNVWGPIHGMRLVLPGMIERRRGHVVNVASGAGRIHIPGLAVYCASKFAVVGLTRTVRDELSGTGVTVTSVLPSAVKTELSSGVAQSVIPFVEPQDIANAIVGSVRKRPAEVTVPGWLGLAMTLESLIPGPIMGVLRTLVRADRGITDLDHDARAAYEERVGAQRRVTTER